MTRTSEKTRGRSSFAKDSRLELGSVGVFVTSRRRGERMRPFSEYSKQKTTNMGSSQMHMMPDEDFLVDYAYDKGALGEKKTGRYPHPLVVGFTVQAGPSPQKLPSPSSANKEMVLMHPEWQGAYPARGWRNSAFATIVGETGERLPPHATAPKICQGKAFFA